MSLKIIDITDKVCPMTTVYVRLSLDKAAHGSELLVLLRGEETRRNVLTLLKTLGQSAECIASDNLTECDYRVSFRKS